MTSKIATTEQIEDLQREHINARAAQRAEARRRAESAASRERMVLISARELTELMEIRAEMRQARTMVRLGAVLAMVMLAIAISVKGWLGWSWLPMLGAYAILREGRK